MFYFFFKNKIDFEECFIYNEKTNNQIMNYFNKYN